MPGDDRIGFDKQEELAPFGPKPRKNNPQHAIRSAKLEPSSIASLQNGELVAESQNLHLKRGPRPQCGCKPDKHRYQHVTHGSRR
jgi:hypothetical protein